ncbi:MAG: hemin uptake protein HemP [Pirellulales bacterium]|nr:hemin uptake protein HemP [Pirellulales bacterium]
MKESRESDMPVRESSGTPEVQRVFESESLFHGAKQIRIKHLETEYLLRITKSNKLILTR